LYMPVRPTHEMHAHEMHAHEMHAHKTHAYEMHVLRCRPIHAYKVHAGEMHAYEIHATRCTPTRCTPTRCTPTRCMPMRCTPMRCHRKTICVRSTPHANSPSPEFALEIAPLIHSAGLAWVVAQCHGEIPRVPEFQHQVPAYRRVAMRDGLISDDMGISKTIQTLGFITWMSENYASLGAGTPIPPHQNIQPEGEGEFRPSLVIAPTSVAYQ
jgi:hypothetical protein